MKKLILSILFILCLSFQASAWNPMVVVSGGSGAASCVAPQAPSETDAENGSLQVGKYNLRTRVATEFVYTGTNGKAICKIRVYVSFVGTSTHNYTAAIYSDSSGPNEAIGTSDAYDMSTLGDAAGEDTFDFEFSTPTSALTNSSTYWVVLQSVADADDESNHAVWYRNITGVTNDTWDYDTTGPGWTTVAAMTMKYILYSQ